MKIKYIAVGNSGESFVENRLTDGINVISSDDNNKGKTIIIQSMLYAMGNEPVFPLSFPYKNYYYVIGFEINGVYYEVCRFGNDFVVNTSGDNLIFSSVNEFRQFLNRKIFKLPRIRKDEKLIDIDLSLFFQIFFIGQDKKDTSSLSVGGRFNKNDFEELLYAYRGVGDQKLIYDKMDSIKIKLRELKDEKKVISSQNKILKSKDRAVTYLSEEADRNNFKIKVDRMESIIKEISEIRRERDLVFVRKRQWSELISELNSINKIVKTGKLQCAECHSDHILFNMAKNKENSSFSFDVSTTDMRQRIVASIKLKIDLQNENINHLNAEIEHRQKLLNELIKEDDISLENIVIYKKDILNVSDAEIRLKELSKQINDLQEDKQDQIKKLEIAKDKRTGFLNEIIDEINYYYRILDPESGVKIKSLFTKKTETHSGSEATVFYISKLLALQKVLGHDFPIIIDSFRAEDLSSVKENKVLELFNRINNQFIITTTLKKEEMGKYSANAMINNIDYQCHIPGKLLSEENNAEFHKKILSFGIDI